MGSKRTRGDWVLLAGMTFSMLGLLFIISVNAWREWNTLPTAKQLRLPPDAVVLKYEESGWYRVQIDGKEYSYHQYDPTMLLLRETPE